MLPPVLSPLPPDLALSLSPRSVRALLARVPPESLAACPVALDADDPYSVAEALSYRPVPGELGAMCADLTRIATPVGREAALELLATAAPPAPPASPGRDLRALSVADLSARLVCARGLTRRQARSILKRVRVRVARHFSLRSWLTLVWPRAELPASPEALIDVGRAIHGADFVRGWVAGIERGVLRVVVVYRTLGETFVAGDGRSARARTMRPLACDVLRWDGRDGRVAFSLGRPAMLSDWAIGIGRACAGNPLAFPDRPAFTTKALHEKGAAWLEAVKLPAGVKLLSVIAAEVDHGKRFRARSDTALADLHELGLRARGYLRAITIRFEVAGHDEPIDATIELPWRVILSDERFAEHLRLIMEALEMNEPGALPDDLPSLAPEQPEWRWVDVLTAAIFARSLAAGTLARVHGKRPSGREYRRWGSLLRAFDVPGEETAYVVGEDIAIKAFDAKPESLVWYAIDWAKVAGALRVASGMSETRVTDAPEGCLVIGEVPAPGSKVVVFTLVRAVSEDEVVPLVRQLLRICGHARPFLLVPKGRSLGGAVSEIELTPAQQLGAEDVAWIPGRIAEECGFVEEIEPSVFATKDAPLVLSVARNEAWYGTVRLLLRENQLAMLFALARTDEWMTSSELGRKIAPLADHPDQIVRKARLDLEARFKESFDAAGVSMPEGLAAQIVVVNRRKEYRLGVKAIVR